MRSEQREGSLLSFVVEVNEREVVSDPDSVVRSLMRAEPDQVSEMTYDIVQAMEKTFFLT